MHVTTKWSPEAERYSTMSGLALLFVIVAPVCTWFAVQTDLVAVRAVGVLLIPLALFIWIFTTIRALHQLSIHFWTIPSTYVAFFGGLFAAVCLLISIFFLPDTLANQAASQSFTFSVVQGTNHQGDYTMLVAAAIVQAGTITWCWWYNWRKIKSWHIGGQRNCIADTVE
jgi:hypothetical protein